jgi:hypothetical protein
MDWSKDMKAFIMWEKEPLFVKFMPFERIGINVNDQQ